MGKIVVLASALALGFVSSTKADIIMTRSVRTRPSSIITPRLRSQISSRACPRSTSAVVDNFAITGGSKALTEVDAAPPRDERVHRGDVFAHHSL